MLPPLGDLHRIECWLLHHGLHLKVIRLRVPPPSRLQGECMSCSAKPESKWRKPEVMLPIPRSGTICFRNSPGALVRFSFHEKW